MKCPKDITYNEKNTCDEELTYGKKDFEDQWYCSRTKNHKGKHHAHCVVNGKDTHMESWD